MQIKLKIFIILILFIVGLFIIANVTQILVFNKISNNAMAPSLKNGSFAVASNLKKYTINDLVYFTFATPTGKQELLVRRISGLEGDTIEINDGFLLRNRYIADNPDKVMFNYSIKRDWISDFKIFKNLAVQPKIQNDAVIACVNYTEFKDISRQLLLHKQNKLKTRKEPDIYGSSSENCWNASNYGPIVVPKGYCFVLADNRDNDNDSRHWGFIPLASIKATVIWKGPPESPR